MGSPQQQHDVGHTVRSVSLGTVWRLFRYPFIFLSAIVIPRMMGAPIYGRYAYFMSVYLILDILTDVGITPVFGRFLPEFDEDDKDGAAHFLHGLLLYGVLITLAVIVFVVLPLYVSGRFPFQSTWWLVLGSLLIITKLEGTLFAFIYGLNQIGRYSAKELIRSAATFVFVIVWYLLFGLDGALWALVLNEVTLLLLGLYWSHPYLRRERRPIRFSYFKPYLLFGLTFYAPMLLFSFLQRTGNVFIEALYGSDGSFEQVGYFDIANQFLLLTGTFVGLILTTLLPSASSLYARNEHERIYRWHRTVMTYCAVLVFLAFHALVLMGRHVVVLCLKPEFEPVYGNAVIMGLGMAPIVIAYAGMNLSMLEKKPLVYIWGVVAGMVVMAALCVALIPRLGARGASWASVFGYLCLALTFCIKYHREFREILPGFLKVLALGLVVAPAYIRPLGAVWSVVVFALTTVVYLGLLLLTRAISLADARRLWEALKSRPSGEVAG